MIVAAAIWKKGLIYSVPKPGRHHTIIHAAPRMELGVITSYLIDGEQGFLTDTGTFLDRQASETHARQCGQLNKPLIGSVLTSEDLW